MVGRALFQNVRVLMIVEGEQGPLALFLVYPSSNFVLFFVIGINPQDPFRQRSMCSTKLHMPRFYPILRWKGKSLNTAFLTSQIVGAIFSAKNRDKLGGYPKSKRRMLKPVQFCIESDITHEVELLYSEDMQSSKRSTDVMQIIETQLSVPTTCILHFFVSQSNQDCIMSFYHFYGKETITTHGK